MRKDNGSYPSLRFDATGAGVVSQAGSVLLIQTARRGGLDQALSASLDRWRKPLAVHDPGKVLLDLVMSIAVNQARAAARARVWKLAGTNAPDHNITERHPLVIDLDATLITAHSEKESAAPTFKKGSGHHPLGAWCDHGPDGTGEPLAMLLRPGNAGSNTAADHIAVIKTALAHLPSRTGFRVGRKVLVRIDGAGSTHELLKWMTS